MIVLGIILALVGFFAPIHLLLVVGIVLVVVGLLLGFAPGPWAGGGTTRRRYY